MTAAEQVERIFRGEHGRLLAALIRQFEDFDLAEEALQDALVNALERWQGDCIPENPGLADDRRRADATRNKIRDTRPLLEQAAVDKIVAACPARMGEIAFSDAYEEGKRMTLDEAVASAF